MVNQSIARVLKGGERQYLRGGVCDCGTVLGRGAQQHVEEDLTKLIERKAKAGWSKAKIDRWVSDRKRAGIRPSANIDSFEMWAKILTSAISLPGATVAGLIVHFYDGRIDEEEFAVERREVRATDDIVAALQSMRENELLMVRRLPGARI